MGDQSMAFLFVPLRGLKKGIVVKAGGVTRNMGRLMLLVGSGLRAWYGLRL